MMTEQVKRLWPLLAGLAVLALAWWLVSRPRDASNLAPPRAERPTAIPPSNSHMVVPISISLDLLERRLNQRLPRVLKQVDEIEQACVPAQRLTLCLKRDEDGKCDIGFDRTRITPDVACHLKGEVTRGPIRLSGSGTTLRLTMPLAAEIHVSDAKDRVFDKAATAAAEVRATVQLSLDDKWEPQAKINIDYAWTDKPGIRLVGTRFTFAGKADRALEPHVRALERTLPAELKKLHSRDLLEKVWQQGFTTESLNRENPPVWLRITPQALHVDPWIIKGRILTLPIAVSAITETFIGARPDAPPPTPLPPPAPPIATTGVRLALPVIADYTELEPVLARALAKQSRTGLKLADYGRADVRFGKVTLYPSEGGRLALGLEMEARSPKRYINARGTLWATALPVNDPDSQRVRFTDLQIASQTDSPGFQLLVAIAQAPEIRPALEAELTQDFSRDLDKLLTRVRPRLAALPLGKDVVIRADLQELHNGRVQALGQGLYLPVEARGTARLELVRVPVP
jgi:hypothetical protein